MPLDSSRRRTGKGFERVGKANILIVEDEAIVAADLEAELEIMGYEVCAVATLAEEAIGLAETLRPDLVIMDIVLRGEMDGIEAARQIKDRLYIPVIFLTAYADESMLERAKITEPFGYLLKPFAGQELHITIETALYRAEMQRRLRESEEMAKALLNAPTDSSVLIDPKGITLAVNEKAARELNDKVDRVVGKDLFSYFPEELATSRKEYVDRVIRSGEKLRFVEVLKGRYLDTTLYPVFNDQGAVTRIAIYMSDITERKVAEERLQWESEITAALSELYKPLIAPFTSMQDITSTILEWAKKLTGSMHGLVSSIDPQNGDNIVHTFSSMLDEQCTVEKEKQKVVFPLGEDGRYPGLWGHPLNTREPMLTNSPQEHPSSAGVPAGHIAIKRFMSVPVMLGQQLVGQIALCNKVTDYTERDLKAILRVAEFYALALQRKRVEDALQESEERYRSLFKDTLSVMLLVDPESARIIDANNAACRFYGYSITELTNKKVSEINTLPGDQVDSHLRKAEQGEQNHFFFRHRLADGELRDVEVYSGPIKVYGRHLIYSIVHDITDRKRAEEALQKAHEELERKVEERTAELRVANDQLRMEIEERKRAEETLSESEERYRTLVESSSDAIMTMDDERSIVSCNPAFLEMFGYEKSEIEGKHVRIIHSSDDSFRFFSKENYGKIERDGFLRAEWNFRRKDGSIFPADIVSSILKSSDGSRKGFVVIIRDISLRKQNEELIRLLTHQLLKAQETERQKISHELHDSVAQNLSALQIGIDTVFDDWPEAPPALKQKVAAMSSVLQASLKEVRDLSYDLRPASLDHLGLIQAILNHCEEFSARTGIETDFSAAGVDDGIMDAETQITLFRLVQEGLNNVRKHSEATKATVRLVASHPHLILRIEDNGKGFDIEQRVVSALSEKRMGLQSMKERVGFLNGRMNIESNPRKGTKILIEVPHREK